MKWIGFLTAMGPRALVTPLTLPDGSALFKLAVELFTAP
jgi:hypothetical protein